MTPSMMTRKLLILGTVATLALATGACSAGSETKAETKSASATDDGGATKTTTTESGSTDTGSDETPTTTPKVEDVEAIGSSTGKLEADPNDDTLVPLRLDILSVERLEGETVEVRFTVTNTGTDGDATFEPWTELGDPSVPSGTYDVGGMALLDRPHDKKYLALYDSNDVCLCSEDLGNAAIAPGETAEYYADVTAPPTSVKTVDLSLPGFQPITGLEIS